jgi:catechol 2,3-dioxygenase-like lactoylglutathione lyase family enzyme
MADTSDRARILRGAPYFPVPDVAKAGAHYRDVFGFHLEYAAGTPPEFAVYSRDGCPLMFRRAPDADRIVPNEAQGGTWDAFFWVTDVQALHDELERRGAELVYGLTVQPYGMKEFAARDPDGYVLGFGQPWPPPGEVSS